MAATAWTFYDVFKDYVATATPADGNVDLTSDQFLMALYQSASNADTGTLTVIGEPTSEVAAGNGYAAGGKTLAGITWSIGGDASTMRFDAANPIWTASGGAINNIKYAVIYRNGASASADKLVCRSTLTTTEFDLSTGNTLTVTFNASGIFELA